MEVLKLNGNKYDFYIITDSNDYIDSVDITNYTNTDSNALSAVFTETIDNNSGFELAERRYKLEWTISSVDIQAAPSDFDIRINFI
jgi:hypothetical protein